MDVTTRGRVDVVVQLPRSTTSRLQRELGAFARYCVMRIERELGAREHWQVTIAPTAGGVFASQVAVTSHGVETERTGRGHDAALAIWDAMCRIEQLLREQRVA